MSGRTQAPGSALRRHPHCAATDHARVPLSGLPSGQFTVPAVKFASRATCKMYFTKDVRILFATRITRLFAYGFLSVVLALYLIEAGLSAWQIGMLLALTLAGDAAISLWLTTNADRIGRRRMLTVGAGLMLLAGIVFLITHNPLVLTAAAIVGVISPSGNEIGPFLSIEQAALSQLVADENRTRLFAWYNLAGSFATATGALAGGWLAQSLQSNGWTKLASSQIAGRLRAGRPRTRSELPNAFSCDGSGANHRQSQTRIGPAQVPQCGAQTLRPLRAVCICRRTDYAKYVCTMAAPAL